MVVVSMLVGALFHVLCPSQIASAQQENVTDIDRLIATFGEDNGDDDWGIGEQAALRLKWIAETDAESVVSALVDILESEDDEHVRSLAVATLGIIGSKAEPAIPVLAAALQDEDLASQAIMALKEIGDAAIPVLINTLDSDDADLRRSAVTALGWMGADAEEISPALTAAVPALTKIVNDHDKGGGDTAAWALWEIEQKPGVTDRHEAMDADELIAVLSDDRWLVRNNAAKALIMIGKDALPKLIEAMEDQNEKVRRHTVWVIGELGEAAESAIPILYDRMENDHDGLVRGKAAIALGKIGVSAVPVLTEALQHRDEDIRHDAAEALGAIGREAAAVIPLLSKVMTHDDDWQTRQEAATALAQIGPAAIPALVGVLEGEDADTRRDAAEALEEMGRRAEAAIPALTVALRDDSEPVRTAAADAISAISPKRLPVPEVLNGPPPDEVNKRLTSLGLTPSPSGLNSDHYRQMMRRDPSAACVGLRTEFEIQGRNLANGFNVDLPTNMSAEAIFRGLERKGAVTEEQSLLVEGVFAACDRLTRGEDLSSEEIAELSDAIENLRQQYIVWLALGVDADQLSAQ